MFSWLSTFYPQKSVRACAHFLASSRTTCMIYEVVPLGPISMVSSALKTDPGTDDSLRPSDSETNYMPVTMTLDRGQWNPSPTCVAKDSWILKDSAILGQDSAILGHTSGANKWNPWFCADKLRIFFKFYKVMILLGAIGQSARSVADWPIAPNNIIIILNLSIRNKCIV